ncbi:MAG: response regulator transcription factor [Actinomycetota bacterium]
MSADPAGTAISVLVVDDQWMIREGLASLAAMAPDIDVVATGGDGNEAVALAEEHRPDVVLMDIRMPGLDGIEATRRIRSIDTGITVLMLTTFEERDLIQRSLAAGAAGYLTKDIAATDLASAIRSAAAGVVQMTPEATRLLVDQQPATTEEPEGASPLRGTGDRTPADGVGSAPLPPLPVGFEGLSPREQDVLRLVATGLNNREIGQRLHLSAGTVKNHVSAIIRRLGTADRTEAAVLATRHGLI